MWILVRDRGRQYTKIAISAVSIFACQNWQWQKVRLIREKHNGNILKKFIGTAEELSFMEQLRNFESEKMINLVMHYCNGAEPVSFLDAYIHLRGRKQEDREKVTLLLPYKKLFKDWLFDDVMEKGLTAVPPHHQETVFCLLNFFEKKAFHEQAISNFMSIWRNKKEEEEDAGGREIHLSTVMAKHVFSHLTPDHSYMIDERAISQPLKCPCGIKGCDKVLNFGNTSIGSSQSWHGSVDIVINDKVPVIIVTDPIDECYGNGYDIDSNGSDSEWGYNIDSNGKDSEWGYLEMDPNEPVGESTEMENTSSLDIMYRKKIQDQILSQAITNAFVQLNTNPSLKGMFIPSLGCSQDYIFAFLYDPENDVLLKTPDFEICQNNTELNKMGLIHAWMFLNFTALFKSDVASKLKISRFHNVVGDSLHDYRKAGKRLHFFQHNENDGYRRAYEIMYRNGKIVGD